MLKKFFQLIIVFISLQLPAQEYVQTIGDPIEDGQFRHAAGIAVDADGNVYVGDANENTITKFDPNGGIITVFGEPGTQPGQFNFRFLFPGVFTILPPPSFKISDQNQLLITDVKNHRIQTFTLEGQFVSTFGSLGSGNGQFDTPAGIAQDSEGNLYVSDSRNHRIQKFTPDGTFLRKWGTEGSGNGQFGFTGPTGIVVDNNDNILVADGSNGRIQVFDSTGVYLSEIGQPLPPTYFPPLAGNFPTNYGYLDLAIDSNDSISVTDYQQAIIHKFGPNGAPGSTFPDIGTQLEDGALGHPVSIAVDENDNVFVVDGESYCANCRDLNHVRKFNSSGEYVTTFGGPVSSSGQLDSPSDMIVDHQGIVYVVDTDNNRIQKFNQNGIFLDSFGEFSFSGSNDTFNRPNGICVDRAGNIYVSDSYNWRIQKFTSDLKYIRTIGEYGLDGDGRFAGSVEDIETDESANVYSIEQFKNQVQKFDSTGQFLKRWSLNTAEHTFSFALDIAVDTTNKIVYTMTIITGFPEQYFVVKHDYEGNHLGTLENIATYGSISLSSNGTLLVTANDSFGKVFEYSDSGQLLNSWGGQTESDENLRFHRPNSTTFDKEGFFYVADSWNHRVQKIRLSVNENAPVISAQKFTVAENSPGNTEIGTIVASDPNDLPLTWSILSGNDPGYVNIETSTGALLLNDSSWFDYESNTSLNLVVAVSNGTTSSVADVAIEIVNVNEAPVPVEIAFELVENSTNGTTVGIISTTDPESDEVTYSITSGGAFAIGSTSGEILVLDNTALDFEATPEIELNITVSDGTLTSESRAMITLIDVNEPPEAEDQQFEVDEHVDNGTVVGIFTAEDPETDELDYAIISGNQLGIFTINAQTGEISVADNRSLDFETIQGVTLGIEVSESEFSVQALVEITINNVEETITSLQEESFEGIKIYPNPAGDFISVEAPQATGPLSIEITDLSGRLVKRIQNVDDPVKHGLSKGTYVVMVKVGEELQVSERLVIR